MSHPQLQQTPSPRSPGCDATTSTQESGNPIEAWFKAFFKTVVAISTVGAGFTFGAIFTDLELGKPPPNFNPESVQARLTVCWLLFVIALALSAGFGAYSALIKGSIVETRGDLVLLSLLSLLLQLLLIGAFMAASLALMPYNKIGLGAVILTGISGILLVVIWGVVAVSPPNDPSTIIVN